MGEVNTFGTPSLHIRSDIEDPKTAAVVEQLRATTEFWLLRLQGQTDAMAGIRGEPKFFSTVNGNGQRITNVEAPVDPNDAMIKANTVALNEAGTAFDAKGICIANVGLGVAPSEAVTQQQLSDAIRDVIRKLTPVDHGELVGLLDDDHLRYVHNDNPRTITAQHTFNPLAPQAPFALAANAQGQLVTGLNADLLDSEQGDYYRRYALLVS